MLVSVDKLRVEFDADGSTLIAVDDLGFQIAAGECLCVVGESGAGKSVTALALMRLLDYEGGRIAAGRMVFRPGHASGRDLAAGKAAALREIRGNLIGMIFQEPMTSLNPVFTIGNQLIEPLIVHRGVSPAHARVQAQDMLGRLRIPDPARIMGQYPHQLSGGMRQRVVIAMAMLCQPRLLICDEPTTALDVTNQAEILILIDQLRRDTGMGVLFITHDMAVVAQMAGRVVVMRDGRKIEEGSVTDIFERPRQDYTRALLAAVPRLGDMRGKDDLPVQPAPPLLRVRGLAAGFDIRGGFLHRKQARLHAVEDVSFDIAPGETLSLVGESGCGKTTCGRAVLRLIEPGAGQIELAGTDITALSRSALRRSRRSMQMIFQDPFGSLDPNMRVIDQIAEPLRNFGIGSPADRPDLVAALCDRVHLPRILLRRFPHEMSGGQRQRAAIARALAVNPRLIVADEAVSALDVSVQARILDLLQELQRDLGVALLFISHDMAVVEQISHRVAVMYLGRIVEIGSRRQVFENPQHPYTRQLLSAVPLADPRRRGVAGAAPAPPPISPVYPAGYRAPASVYRQVAAGHQVLVQPARHA